MEVGEMKGHPGLVCTVCRQPCHPNMKLSSPTPPPFPGDGSNEKLSKYFALSADINTLYLASPGSCHSLVQCPCVPHLFPCLDATPPSSLVFVLFGFFAQILAKNETLFVIVSSCRERLWAHFPFGLGIALATHPGKEQAGVSCPITPPFPYPGGGVP